MENQFREEFLHYVWRYRQFQFDQLQTTCCQSVKIKNQGLYNTGSGPDFYDARIHIGATLWAGNVEIHIRASEWYRHGHGQDKAYDNVILHVVYEADVDVYRTDGQLIPCLELKHLISMPLLSRYRDLLEAKSGILCKHLIHDVSAIILTSWLDRLMVERLESKTTGMAAVLERNKNDWEATYYEVLASGFGLKINTQPFGHLARTLPLNTLRRHQGNSLQIEALIFGQAGFLDAEFKDSYPRRLQEEFSFLKEKYKLKPLKAEAWKFLRLRPSGFPTLRLARFAGLISRHSNLFRYLLDAGHPDDFRAWLQFPINDYWNTHYLFDQTAKGKPGKMGKSTCDLLLINVAIPFLFLYGKKRAHTQITQKALDWFELLPPEDNNLIREWKKLHLVPESAAQTQALIHLRTQYCDKKRCLDCSVGGALLRPPQ